MAEPFDSGTPASLSPADVPQTGERGNQGA